MAMDYKIVIRLEDGLAKQKIDELKKSLSGIDGIKNVKLKSDTQPLMDSLSKIGMTLTGLQAGFNITKNTILTFSNVLIKPAADFETLRVRLVNLYQDTEKANQVFEQFKEIAATTPFELRNVVEAGVNLKAFGMNAEDTLKSVTDLAAYMGVDVVEASQAVGRAFAGGAGAADILRERGVLELIKSFKGIEDLTKLTLPEFREALISTLQDPTAGIANSTDRLSKTYEGAMSNMKDAFTNFSASVGSELTPILTISAQSITRFLESLTPVKTELEKVTDETITQRSEFITLVGTYKQLRFEQNQNVKSNDILKKVIFDLNENYGSYLGNIDLATIAYQDFEKAIAKATDELMRETQVKLIKAKMEDMSKESFKKVDDKKDQVQSLESEITDLEKKKILSEASFKEISNARANAQGASSAKMANVAYYELEDSIAKKRKNIVKLNGEIQVENKKLTKELEEYTKRYADLLNSVIDPRKDPPKKDTPPLSDELQKELNSLKKSITDKEELLKKEYETNRKFILANVSDKKEQSKMLHDLDMKYTEDYDSLKKSENDKIKNIYQEQADLHKDLANEKLEIDRQLAQEQYQIEEEKLRAYDEFLEQEYRLTATSEQRRFDEINLFYSQYRDLLVSIGVSEAQIERQRQTRLRQASDAYMNFNSAVSNVSSTLQNQLGGTFSRLVTEGEKFSDVMGSIWKNLVSNILDEFGRLAVLNIFNTLGLNGKNGGSGFFGGLFNIVGALFGVPLPAFASGGQFSGNGGDEDDSNIIRISNHEYVIRAKRAKLFKPLLDTINFAPVSSVNSLIPAQLPALNVPQPSLVQGGFGSNELALFSSIDTKLNKLEKLATTLEVINRNLVNIDPSVYNITSKTDITPDVVRKIESVKKGMISRGETI